VASGGLRPRQPARRKRLPRMGGGRAILSRSRHAMRGRTAPRAWHRGCIARRAIRGSTRRGVAPTENRKEAFVKMAWERSALSSYRAELATLSSLSPEVERSLAERWRAGDQQAGQALVRACL